MEKLKLLITVILAVILVLMLGTASKLKTARKINITGAVSGNANFDGSGNVEINTVQANIEQTVQTISKTDGTTGTITFRQYGKIKYINISVTIPKSALGTINFSIPTDYIPSETMEVQMEGSQDPRTNLKLLLRQAGTGVLVYSNPNTSNSENLHIQETYIVN